MKIHNILSTLLLSIMAACAYTPVMAGVTYYEVNKTVVVDGQTNFNQAINLYVTLKNEEVDTIFMSGPGGSMRYGLQIGEMIQKSGATVYIARNKLCISACAFAAMASKDVRIHGELWVHRPYIPAYPNQFMLDDVGGIALVIGANISRYFVQMGYPIHLWGVIASQTNPCYFLSITSTKDLDGMRGEPLEMKHPVVTHVDMCEGTLYEGR